MGLGELERRQDLVKRLLAGDGTPLDANGRFEQADERRALGAIPALLSQEEWRQIEAGLIQHAELLNLILADI